MIFTVRSVDTELQLGFHSILPLYEGVEDICGTAGDDDGGDCQVDATNKKDLSSVRFQE